MLYKDFLAFLKEYNIINLALAFIMGAASNTVVQSLVDNIIMPWITPFIKEDRWQEAAVQFGPVSLQYGKFAADLLQFLILAFVVFLIAKKVLKELEVKKK